ncbi:hypothetical protein Tco_1125855 [Tanacetum coccineum]
MVVKRITNKAINTSNNVCCGNSDSRCLFRFASNLALDSTRLPASPATAAATKQFIIQLRRLTTKGFNTKTEIAIKGNLMKVVITCGRSWVRASPRRSVCIQLILWGAMSCRLFTEFAGWVNTWAGLTHLGDDDYFLLLISGEIRCRFANGQNSVVLTLGNFFASTGPVVKAIAFYWLRTPIIAGPELS